MDLFLKGTVEPSVVAVQVDQVIELRRRRRGRLRSRGLEGGRSDLGLDLPMPGRWLFVDAMMWTRAQPGGGGCWSWRPSGHHVRPRWLYVAVQWCPPRPRSCRPPQRSRHASADASAPRRTGHHTLVSTMLATCGWPALWFYQGHSVITGCHKAPNHTSLITL